MNLVLIYVFVISLGLSMTAGFVPISRTTTTKTSSSISRPSLSTELFINIGDQERDKLTRESEPGDYFKTWVDTTMNVFLDGSVRIHTQLCANIYIYIYICFFCDFTGIRIKWPMRKSFPLQSLVLRSLRFRFSPEWLRCMPLNRKEYDCRSPTQQ